MKYFLNRHTLWHERRNLSKCNETLVGYCDNLPTANTLIDEGDGTKAYFSNFKPVTRSPNLSEKYSNQNHPDNQEHELKLKPTKTLEMDESSGASVNDFNSRTFEEKHLKLLGLVKECDKCHSDNLKFMFDPDNEILGKTCLNCLNFMAILDDTYSVDYVDALLNQLEARFCSGCSNSDVFGYTLMEVQGNYVLECDKCGSENKIEYEYTENEFEENKKDEHTKDGWFMWLSNCYEWVLSTSIWLLTSRRNKEKAKQKLVKNALIKGTTHLVKANITEQFWCTVVIGGIKLCVTLFDMKKRYAEKQRGEISENEFQKFLIRYAGQFVVSLSVTSVVSASGVPVLVIPVGLMSKYAGNKLGDILASQIQKEKY